MLMRTIFETCKPRADVQSGATRDEQFAADLAEVVNQTAPKEYSDPATFFHHTYPTRGLKKLIETVCKRLSGNGGELASIIRLDTQFGGGKTHSLIALTHAVRGMKGVQNPGEFVDVALLPKEEVRVAALDGENADPTNGRLLEKGVFAKSLWGELAYRVAGIEGFRRVEESDKTHVAPGADTLKELFAGRKVLILIDEIAVYLRKVERAFPGQANQFAAFTQALFKAVESSPGVVLVITLAVGKDAKAHDAYRDEQMRAMEAFAEADSVIARKATQFNPTEEDETTAVLRRRLFEHVDESAADAAVDAYFDVWTKNAAALPAEKVTADMKKEFRRGYPLHPETLTLLTEKLSTLDNFQRTRGMLRLLARTVHYLWETKPKDALAIHPHHIDVGFPAIRDEVTTRLGQGAYAPAIKADVAEVLGNAPATAQAIDAKHYPGQIPITSYIARTALLNTLAYGDTAQGISAEGLNFSVCSPEVEPSFIDQARKLFLGEALYLDDRPGAPLRFMVEPNLEAVVRRIMQNQIASEEVRTYLQERIRELFGSAKGAFDLVPFPAGCYEVDDTVGDGRPRLALLHYEALAVGDDIAALPDMVAEIFQFKGADKRLRELQNNLVVVAVSGREVANMQDRVKRSLALKELLKPDHIRTLPPHQQEKVKEEDKRSRLFVAEAILQGHRHLFFPHHIPMPGGTLPVAHAVIEVQNASADPGNGQAHVSRVLRDHRKLLGEGDKPEAPQYVRDQTPLKQKGEITTQDLRNEYRRAPKLSILLSDSPLVSCIREGIDSEVFIYRQGDQVWGKGDPSPAIKVADDAFVHTIADARQKKLWPRPEPMSVSMKATPVEVQIGSTTDLTVSVTGGTPPYTYSGSDPGLDVVNTSQTVLRCTVAPATSGAFEVEVKDSRGQRQTATARVTVIDTGKLAVRFWPSQSSITLGQSVTLNVAIHGGKAPFTVVCEACPDLARKQSGDTAFSADVSPGASTTVAIEITDSKGEKATASLPITVNVPKKPELSAEGPLPQAITHLAEKARAANVGGFESLVIRMFEADATWKLHQALATLKGATVTCELDADLSMDGVERFQVGFAGSLTKANSVKAFLEPQIRAATHKDFRAAYTVVFDKPLSTKAADTDRLSSDLTRYGSGEAYVEATATAAETGK
jgi:hypothetical protein